MFRIMLDTNVLLDYYFDRNADHGTVRRLIRRLAAEEEPFLVTPSCLKDFYYLTITLVKREIRAQGADVGQVEAEFANRYAWGCLSAVRDMCIVASEGLVDCDMATGLRSFGNDFEDNLLLACAMRCEVDYLVTSDRRLLDNPSVNCVTPEQMIGLLEAVTGDGSRGYPNRAATTGE